MAIFAGPALERRDTRREYGEVRIIATGQAHGVFYTAVYAAFAAWIGIPLATLRNWEQGRTNPDPSASALMRVMAREPEAARRALGNITPGPTRSQRRRSRA